MAALSGHVDGVNVLARHPTRQNYLLSGGSDGGKSLIHCSIIVSNFILEIRIWDVSEKYY